MRWRQRENGGKRVGHQRMRGLPEKEYFDRLAAEMGKAVDEIRRGTQPVVTTYHHSWRERNDRF